MRLTTWWISTFRRDDISHVPVVDMPPRQYRLVWRGADHRAEIRAFARVAEDVVRAGGSP